MMKIRTFQRLKGFQTACNTILPKVDPLLVEDVILRQQHIPQEQLIYTIDVLSDGSRNPDDIKKDILADTGMVPSIYEHGTHYVVNQKISLETLEKIQKYPMYKRSNGNILAAMLQGELRTSS
jgi:hypothetical protein